MLPHSSGAGNSFQSITSLHKGRGRLRFFQRFGVWGGGVVTILSPLWGFYWIAGYVVVVMSVVYWLLSVAKATVADNVIAFTFFSVQRVKGGAICYRYFAPLGPHMVNRG